MCLGFGFMKQVHIDDCRVLTERLAGSTLTLGMRHVSFCTRCSAGAYFVLLTVQEEEQAALDDEAERRRKRVQAWQEQKANALALEESYISHLHA
jgi:hypothetical protein